MKQEVNQAKPILTLKKENINSSIIDENNIEELATTNSYIANETANSEFEFRIDYCDETSNGTFNKCDDLKQEASLFIQNLTHAYLNYF